MLVPCSVKLLDCSNNHTFYNISTHLSDYGNNDKKCLFPLTLRYFNSKVGVLNYLDFCEDFNETKENIKQKHVDILLKYKLDMAYPSMYSADNANVNFGKFYSVY